MQSDADCNNGEVVAMRQTMYGGASLARQRAAWLGTRRARLRSMAAILDMVA
jgi:hypothetical protein